MKNNCIFVSLSESDTRKIEEKIETKLNQRTLEIKISDIEDFDSEDFTSCIETVRQWIGWIPKTILNDKRYAVLYDEKRNNVYITEGFDDVN